MSIKSWLENKRQERHKKAIIKNKKRIKTRYGQGEPRYRAMEFFTQLANHQGYSGLLERFMVNVEPAQTDENEKEEVFKTLVSFGEVVVPAIEEYLNRKDAASVPLSWPLKILDAICKPENSVSVIVRALDSMGTQYTRQPEKKVLLVSQLAEYNDPRVVPALIPYLNDHRDEVQLEALQALVQQKNEAAREPMLELMIAEESPVRLRAAVAGSMAKLGWLVKGYRKAVEKILPEGLRIDRSGHIKGRWIHASAEDADEES